MRKNTILIIKVILCRRDDDTLVTIPYPDMLLAIVRNLLDKIELGVTQPSLVIEIDDTHLEFLDTECDKKD